MAKDKSKLCAVLAYVLIGIVWFFADKKMRKNQFAEFHVKQAIVLLVFALVLNIVLGILVFLAFLFPLVQLAVFILWLFGVIYALTNQKKKIPIIGEFGTKLKF